MRYLLLLFISLLLTLPARSQLSDTELEIARYVTTHAEEQVDLLEKVVNINSGTMNAEGVRAVGRVFAEELEKIGFESEWIELPDSLQRAGHLFAYRKGGAGRRLLLIGHLDTVFEPGNTFEGFVREGDRGIGPGVTDMKGGDVVILYALKALHAAGALHDATITVALIGDEEKPGDVAVSRAPLLAAAEASDVALGFEGSTGLGWGTVARRGSSGWKLEVTGRQAHSSGIFSERVGAGAIFETARILDAFYAYVRGEEFLTFNAGVILGGTTVDYDSPTSTGTAFGKTNVVASTVVVEGGLRFITEAQKDSARARMRAVVEHGNLPQTSARITFTDSYPAMPPTAGNHEVLSVLDQVSRDLGHGPVAAWDPGRRGAADISFVAHLVPGIDGLGTMGGNTHAPGEWVDLSSMPILTQRAALLMYRLTRMEP